MRGLYSKTLKTGSTLVAVISIHHCIMKSIHLGLLVTQVLRDRSVGSHYERLCTTHKGGKLRFLGQLIQL